MGGRWASSTASSRTNAAGGDALDAGTLSVAKAEGDGVRWVALPAGSALDPAGAAERAGATRFDTPSGLVFDARGQRLFLACRAGTTRSRGQVDALNPRSGPNAGHVLEIAGEPAADRMAARVLLRAEGQMANPATLALDGRGRIWIGTDRGGVVGAAPDALFGCDLDGAGRGVARPLYAAPRAGAIGGAAMVPGDDQLLVMVRTPGASPGASFDNPATRWPAFDPIRRCSGRRCRSWRGQKAEMGAARSANRPYLKLRWRNCGSGARLRGIAASGRSAGRAWGRCLGNIYRRGERGDCRQERWGG